MQRAFSISITLIACLAVLGAATAFSTPPKKPAPGTTSPGEAQAEGKSNTARPANRGGVSPATWMDLVSRIDVSVAQQDELTPIIRRYLAALARWSKVGSVELIDLMARARDADEVDRVVLVGRIRALRRSMPRYDRVKEQVWRGLTPFQQGRLLELTQATNASGGGLSSPADEDSRGLERPEVAEPPKEVDASADGMTPETNPKTKSKPKSAVWCFRNDLDPRRHVDSERAPASGEQAKTPPGNVPSS